MDKIKKTKEEWKKELTVEQYHILRNKGTESPGTGEYVDTDEMGMYHCAACEAPLFSSESKFHSGSGWPSFWEAVDPEAIEKQIDNSLGMARTEIVCAKCGGHLGHLFNDGPKEKTGKRFCVNSASLKLKKTE